MEKNFFFLHRRRKGKFMTRERGGVIGRERWRKRKKEGVMERERGCW